MISKAQLKAYNKTLQGWIRGQVSEAELDLLAKTGWITVEQAEQIKATKNVEEPENNTQ